MKEKQVGKQEREEKMKWERRWIDVTGDGSKQMYFFA